MLALSWRDSTPTLFWYGGALLVPLIPADTLRRYRSIWSRTADPNKERLIPEMQWLASQGDTAVLAHLVAVAPRGTDDAAVARAFLALARRDTSDAVARFLALPDSSLLLRFNMRLAKAQLLRATGHLREAARMLEPTLSPWGSDYYPGDGVWHLERGRTRERLGDRMAARRAYRTVLDLWRHADPELQPLVAEARDAMARLDAKQ
jgi:hypothetical protein